MRSFSTEYSDVNNGLLPLNLQREIIATEAKRGVHTYSPFDAIMARAKGVWMWDVTGRRYLDCFSSYSAVNQGHCHPRIMAALVHQAETLTITSRAYRHDRLAAFYETICALTGAEKVLPMNSGAEAVESALKVARRWGYQVKGIPSDRAEVIVCCGNFHGRTLSIVSFSTDRGTRQNFGPFGPGFSSVPFCDVEALERAIGPNTVAFLVEPIQGEAGMIVPPAQYFPQIRQLCSENNVLLILDEIQTGLGRTGRLLAQDHEAIKADVTLIGKSLSGGFYPVSAVLSSAEILDVLGPGSHGSTFGGNPLACAIAIEALRVLADEAMIDNANRMGELFRSTFEGYNSKAVVEVRGRGLMIGIELIEEIGHCRNVSEALLSRGIVCKDINPRVIRVSPPLIIEPAEVAFVCETLAEVLDDFMPK